MKTKLFLLFLSAALCPVSSGFAQGSLTPPGAPMPTMKSLDQVKAGTLISSAPFTISTSGNYFLTKNVSVTTGDAITISASNVTLDLNGFTISSTAGSANGTAVLINSGLRNITISNGFINSGVTVSGGVYSGSGFANGISASGTSPEDVRVCGISVSGVLNDGIYLDISSTLIQSCFVDVAGSTGLYASTVTDSTANNCGSGYGIGGVTASNCNGVSATGDGVHIFQNATNCVGTSAGGATTIGLYANTATNCSAYHTGSGTGLSARIAINCYGSSANGTGVKPTSANNCYGIANGSGDGINSTGSVLNSYGSSASGTGVVAAVVNNSYGVSSSGSGTISGPYGVRAFNMAISSYGSIATGIGLFSSVAVACAGNGTIETVHASFKYNMPGCNTCP